MNPEDLVIQRNIPKQVGQKLVDICDQVLAENLKRDPTPEELGELAQTMISELLGASYLIIRGGQGGAAEAEAWLKRTLGSASAAVRLRGSDALIKFDVTIRDLPNKLVPKPASDPAAHLRREPPPLPPCVCEKAADGSCPGCVEKTSARFKRFFGFFHQMMRFQQETKDDTCKACEKDAMDPAIAAIVPSLFEVSEMADPDAKAQFAQEIMGVVFQMASMAGVTEMPLTIDAWKKAVEKAGVAVDQPE